MSFCFKDNFIFIQSKGQKVGDISWLEFYRYFDQHARKSDMSHVMGNRLNINVFFLTRNGWRGQKNATAAYRSGGIFLLLN